MHVPYFIKEVIAGRTPNLSNSDIYTFGVYTGSSMQSLQLRMKDAEIRPSSFYGFDSFGGLPPEDPSVAVHSDHVPGTFSSKDYFKNDSIENIIDAIKRDMAYGDITTFIPGFFSDSLREADKLVLKYSMKPAALVEVDVDLYISTVELLDFMYSSKLIIPGTVIYYDDWGGGIVEYSGGESLAHKQACDKYNVECEKIFEFGDGNPHKKMTFIVKSVG